MSLCKATALGDTRGANHFVVSGRNVNGEKGPKSTIWMIDPSGRSTYLLMWIVHQFWHTGGFDDKKVRKFDFATSIEKKHIN